MCGKLIAKGEPVAGFSAFLPRHHELIGFSDAVFHRACLDAHPGAPQVKDLYARFRRVLDHAPRAPRSLADVEAWQRAALARLWNEEGFRTADANRLAMARVGAPQWFEGGRIAGFRAIPNAWMSTRTPPRTAGNVESRTLPSHSDARL